VATIDFDAKVKPFFATYCFRCHGPNRQSGGGTRFDTKAGILARVTPGDPDNSKVVHMITATDEDHMPPPTIQDQPSADDIAMIKQWIKEGANIPDSYPSGT
jgi:mono/diheme cytochrome c family protein